ncbi:AAA family ATPase [Bifidobacterium sp. W8116]|uniref:AAA family ATPase n=1 Tax=Bifidobacterium choladohabitans TaxID=2750947 RepID=A0ABS0QXZ2_9BIFI|nr:AAA family ATPase [Bifidobacterium choladohabitans]MBI0143304.1 AAA family ATPase [Bifidobacterium choladohabitans]
MNIINKIQVLAPYCFGEHPLVLDNLGKVNFIFAPNGSGKTTISRELAKQPEAIEERRSWETAQTDLAIRVFNDEYKQSIMQEHMNGIFTMGQESQKVNDAIKVLEDNIKDEEEKQEKLRDEIGDTKSRNYQNSLRGRIEQARLQAMDSVFNQHKLANDNTISLVFKGYRKSKDKLFTEALRQYEERGEDNSNKGTLSWGILEKRVSSLSNAEKRDFLPSLTITSIFSAESQKILEAELHESSKGEFAPLIEYLKNADWVNQGRAYAKKTDGICPFCQQKALRLSEQLAEYFENGYDQEVAKIDKAADAVLSEMSQLQEQLHQLESKIKNDEEIESKPFEAPIREVQIDANSLIRKINDKKSHPTDPTVFSESVSDIKKAIDLINQLITDENRKVEEHNRLVDDTEKATEGIIYDGWSIFLNDPVVKATLSGFKVNQRKATIQQNKLQGEIDKSKKRQAELESNLVTMRSSISNTVEVADRINKLLHASGFDRFHLSADNHIAGGYRVVRDNDEIAIQTLSEGEKSFICFAYYWESLEGSFEANKSPEEVVAVIDDPISSLDSDTLFIVSQYIRKAAADAVSGTGNIKQLIVLTHNVQFHHEASYCPGKPKVDKRHYYRLLKSSTGITECRDDGNSSQIRNTYQMLWDSVVEAARTKNESDTLRIGITNIVRRIVEGYFMFLGGKRSVSNRTDLSVSDQRIMQAFEIWANAGSHTIADDIDQTIDIGSTHRFIRLFRRYFEERGQVEHFDTMIKNSGGADLLAENGFFARP